ncbi:MAG: hypothetical protein ISS70_23980 [Phycisphaerae bacterium]|nr:hypothetical protein [Phycisphaerae bacterium]
MKLGKGNLSGGQKLILAMLIVGPLVLMVCKWSALPTSEFFMRGFSLANLSGDRESRVEYILSVPFGATLVVFFRLSLGIRLLGPFRSILLAVAFLITGILPGLAFLAVVIGIVLAIRPFVKAIRLPYFARVSVVLSVVALVMLIALLSSRWLGFESLSRVAYFPIIALCLMGEGFARILSREGLGSALWRGTMTAFVAVLITFMFQIDGFRKVFLYFPELLIFEIGFIIVIAEFLDFRLLRRLNLPAEEKSSSRHARKAKSLVARAHLREDSSKKGSTI